MCGDYIERYNEYNKAFLMSLDKESEEAYSCFGENSADYINYNNSFFNNSLYNKSSAYYEELFINQQQLESINNIYDKNENHYLFSDAESYSIYKNNFVYDGDKYNACNTSQMYYDSMSESFSYYSDYNDFAETNYNDNTVSNNQDNSVIDSVDNKYYDYINTSDIKDSVSNSYTEKSKSINISLGGITQNFSGSENAENIADSLCDYLRKALSNGAEGVYF